jgi:hypothetical protein
VVVPELWTHQGFALHMACMILLGEENRQSEKTIKYML